MKIVIDDRIPFIRGAFEPFAEVLYLPGKEISPVAVRDADALVTRTRTICGRGLLAGSSVKVIATATIGYDHIDTLWCEGNGIVWSNAPGCNSGSVCQYVASVLVSLARRHSLKLSEMTLGVVGVGNVGGKVAAMAEALGMRVLLNDPPRERREGPGRFVSLDALVAESDVVTLHVPLQMAGEDATFHLFDDGRLSAMRSGQFLINSSRGPVVDNAALKEALASGLIGGAVLDVWENEPDIDRELMRMLEFSTPHIAGYSADGKANGTAMSVHTVARILDLPLLGWTPECIPAPACPLDFSIDAAGKTLADVLSEAVLHTYDVESDSAALRAAPEDFEKLRGYYPVRREPSAFAVRLNGDVPGAAASLEKLGFKVLA